MNKTTHQFKRILIANRGEIAVRIMKTAKQMGIETIAIYTNGEQEALHVKKADIKVLLQGDTLNETYLNIEQIISLAQKNYADAIHPGYGFLSENDAFATACLRNSIVFIGPSPKQIKLMGNKSEANKIAQDCNIPMLKKVEGTLDVLIKQAHSLNLPIIIKAAAGGGGKGMRIVTQLKHLNNELNIAANEALRYFGNASIYLEEYITNPRHIEVQILADQHNNCIHLFERECSIQRRHQKVIEEAPAPNLNQDVRQQIIKDALSLSKKIAYTSAGTVEFLLTPNNRHFFLEMNTRIQVEHPVSEKITGIDIVKEQIKIAMGMPLKHTQESVKANGHAIEARIYAENPEEDYSPSFGQIIETLIPNHPNIRIDGGANPNENLNPNFDPLLKKIIAHGNNRPQAIKRLKNFFKEYALFGVETNRELILETLNDKDFTNGNYSTSFFETKKELLLSPKPILINELEILSAAYLVAKNGIQKHTNNLWNKIGYWRQIQYHTIRFSTYQLNVHLLSASNNALVFKLNNKKNIELSSILIEENQLSFFLNKEQVKINYLIAENGLFYFLYKGRKRVITDKPKRKKIQTDSTNAKHINSLKSPMPARVLNVIVKVGDIIKKGDPLLVLEAMKTENTLNAWRDITITKICVAKGDHVKLNQQLIVTE